MTVLQFETLQTFDIESIGHFYFGMMERYIRELKILQGAKKNLTISRMEVEHSFQKEVGWKPRVLVMPVFVSTIPISHCSIPIAIRDWSWWPWAWIQALKDSKSVYRTIPFQSRDRNSLNGTSSTVNCPFLYTPQMSPVLKLTDWMDFWFPRRELRPQKTFFGTHTRTSHRKLRNWFFSNLRKSSARCKLEKWLSFSFSRWQGGLSCSTLACTLLYSACSWGEAWKPNSRAYFWYLDGMAWKFASTLSNDPADADMTRDLYRRGMATSRTCLQTSQSRFRSLRLVILDGDHVDHTTNGIWAYFVEY